MVFIIKKLIELFYLTINTLFTCIWDLVIPTLQANSRLASVAVWKAFLTGLAFSGWNIRKSIQRTIRKIHACQIVIKKFISQALMAFIHITSYAKRIFQITNFTCAGIQISVRIRRTICWIHTVFVFINKIINLAF